ISNGRIPIFIEYSASRAERFAERTAANVASASTSVPPAVASDAIVVQSAIARAYPASLQEVVERPTDRPSHAPWDELAFRSVQERGERGSDETTGVRPRGGHPPCGVDRDEIPGRCDA